MNEKFLKTEYIKTMWENFERRGQMTKTERMGENIADKFAELKAACEKLENEYDENCFEYNKETGVYEFDIEASDRMKEEYDDACFEFLYWLDQRLKRFRESIVMEELRGEEYECEDWRF